MLIKKEITTRTKPHKILEYFRECNNKSTVNLKTSFGYIYLTGGILSKLDGDKHYIAINGKWVLIHDR